MSYTLADVCDHCGSDLGQHLVPDSRCPVEGATTYFFMAAYHQPHGVAFPDPDDEIPLGPKDYG